MSQILIEQNQKMDELERTPNDRDSDLPINWYRHTDLYLKEALKRFDDLNSENLSINELKARLINAEMFINFQIYTELRLIQLSIEGRITIKKAIDHGNKAKENRTTGRRNQTKSKKIKAKEIFDEITGELKSMNPKGWRLFKLRLGRANIIESTARNYWKEFTGFDNVKSSQDLSNEID